MKKAFTLLIALFLLTGCLGNQNTLGIGNYRYNFLTCKEDYADFKNEPVKSWKDYEGEQLEVTLENGNNILLSPSSCFLSKEIVE